MPLRKVHELAFLWFGLPGPLLTFDSGDSFLTRFGGVSQDPRRLAQRLFRRLFFDFLSRGGLPSHRKVIHILLSQNTLCKRLFIHIRELLAPPNTICMCKRANFNMSRVVVSAYLYIFENSWPNRILYVCLYFRWRCRGGTKSTRKRNTLENADSGNSRLPAFSGVLRFRMLFELPNPLIYRASRKSAKIC